MPIPNIITITSPKTNLKPTNNQHKKIKIKEKPPHKDNNKYTKPKSPKSQKKLSKLTSTPNYNTISKQLDKNIKKHNPIITPKFLTLSPPIITTLYTNTTSRQKNIINSPKENSPKLEQQKTNKNNAS